MDKASYPVTPAVRLLREKEIVFGPHLYAYEERGGANHSAEELRVDEHAVIKTLVMETDSLKPLIVLMQPEEGSSMSDANQYEFPALNEEEADPNPFKQFERWFNQAEAIVPILPNAMTLATATREGVPSARVVLLKDFDERGFVFYTNYQSQKGHVLDENPIAALSFYWAEPARQVRITGTATRTSRSESEAYFHSRPIDSQLGAWASNQSDVIGGRDVLERRMEELLKEHHGKRIPLPPYWGGYRVAPFEFEFWQNRARRLHDRLRYKLGSEGDWLIERLAP